jgi:hypothetical protein
MSNSAICDRKKSRTAKMAVIVKRHQVPQMTNGRQIPD